MFFRRQIHDKIKTVFNTDLLSPRLWMWVSRCILNVYRFLKDLPHCKDRKESSTGVLEKFGGEKVHKSMCALPARIVTVMHDIVAQQNCSIGQVNHAFKEGKDTASYRSNNQE